MVDADGELDVLDGRQFNDFGFGNITPGLLRIPIILGIEALISGRILHEGTPFWWTASIWIILTIPILLSDEHLPQYYKLVFVYGIHSLLNLVDSFLINLARPETRPIWGLIGLEAMKLEDFQYLVRIVFMTFNLLFFRGLICNLVSPNEEDQLSWTHLLPALTTITLIFGNSVFFGELILLFMRCYVLLRIFYTVIYMAIFYVGPDIYSYVNEKIQQDPSNSIRVVLKLIFDRISDINPTPYVILQALLKSAMIKAMLHFTASILQLNDKVYPVMELSPQMEDLSFSAMNSTGLAILNMTAFSIKSFTNTGYFSPCFSTNESIILISTDSLLTVFCIAYFFSVPGEYIGLAIQRWLVNGVEPQDPHERGARMGQFLAMLHSFMALQTGITYMDPQARLDRFDKNLWLIGIACMHYLHEMVDAELTHVNDMAAVQRPLNAMGGLLFIAVLIDVHLLLHFEISTWWIPVFVFTLELIMKATTSFVVFFMQRNDFNEDYIFWTKMTSKCCELLGGCIMLLNAIYVLIFQKPIMLFIRVIMMLIHTYFNIYRTFKKGREKIRLRLQAEKQLDNLKEVNVEEIPEPDRLCAICYENFEGGIEALPVIETDCQHRFHKQCIKKWLRLKNVCPLCHRPVFKNGQARDNNPPNQGDMNQNEQNIFMDDVFEDLL